MLQDMKKMIKITIIIGIIFVLFIFIINFFIILKTKKKIVSEKEAGQITSSFIVSNMRSSGENVELRIVSERQPVAGAENVESTLEDAYLYHTQITGGEKNATL